MSSLQYSFNTTLSPNSAATSLTRRASMSSVRQKPLENRSTTTFPGIELNTYLDFRNSGGSAESSNNRHNIRLQAAYLGLPVMKWQLQHLLLHGSLLNRLKWSIIKWVVGSNTSMAIFRQMRFHYYSTTFESVWRSDRRIIVHRPIKLQIST